MPRLRPLLLGAAALAACQRADAPTAPVAAPAAARAPAAAPNAAVVRTAQRVPVVADAVVYNECTGEDMQFHFDELFVMQDLLIEGRAFHTHLAAVDRGSTGVGLATGARYRQVGVQVSTAFFQGEVQTAQTYVQAGRVRGRGVPDATAHVTYHLTVTPEGRVAVEFDNASFTCR